MNVLEIDPQGHYWHTRWYNLFYWCPCPSVLKKSRFKITDQTCGVTSLIRHVDPPGPDWIGDRYCHTHYPYVYLNNWYNSHEAWWVIKLYKLIFILLGVLSDANFIGQYALNEAEFVDFESGACEIENFITKPFTESLFPNVPPSIHFVSERNQREIPGKRLFKQAGRCLSVP